MAKDASVVSKTIQTRDSERAYVLGSYSRRVQATDTSIVSY
jgi:hypothetical protein